MHHINLMPHACWLSPHTKCYYIHYAGPWKELLDTTQEFKLSVELDEARRTAFKCASTSVKALASASRLTGQTQPAWQQLAPLGMAASIGSFASQGPCLTSKISASQYSLGGHVPQHNGVLASAWLYYDHRNMGDSIHKVAG